MRKGNGGAILGASLDQIMQALTSGCEFYMKQKAEETSTYKQVVDGRMQKLKSSENEMLAQIKQQDAENAQYKNALLESDAERKQLRVAVQNKRKQNEALESEIRLESDLQIQLRRQRPTHSPSARPLGDAAAGFRGSGYPVQQLQQQQRLPVNAFEGQGTAGFFGGSTGFHQGSPALTSLIEPSPLMQPGNVFGQRPPQQHMQQQRQRQQQQQQRQGQNTKPNLGHQRISLGLSPGLPPMSTPALYSKRVMPNANFGRG
jgi:hypothetical protein